MFVVNLKLLNCVKPLHFLNIWSDTQLLFHFCQYLVPTVVCCLFFFLCILRLSIYTAGNCRKTATMSLLPVYKYFTDLLVIVEHFTFRENTFQSLLKQQVITGVLVFTAWICNMTGFWTGSWRRPTGTSKRVPFIAALFESIFTYIFLNTITH